MAQPSFAWTWVSEVAMTMWEEVVNRKMVDLDSILVDVRNISYSHSHAIADLEKTVSFLEPK